MITFRLYITKPVPSYTELAGNDISFGYLEGPKEDMEKVFAALTGSGYRLNLREHRSTVTEHLVAFQRGNGDNPFVTG